MAELKGNIKNILVLSSPSGGGKTTVAKYLLEKYDNFMFSISATTRSPRPNETDGKDYHFLTNEQFESKIREDGLLEYEEIYGNYYGTLKSEVESAIKAGKVLIFDVDVKGALSLQKAYPDNSLLIFIVPPDLETLEKRLRDRHTEKEGEIDKRLGRAKMELEQKDKFDYKVVNNDLQDTFKQVEAIIIDESKK